MSTTEGSVRKFFLVNKKGGVTPVREKNPNVRKLLKDEKYNAAYSVREFSPKIKFLLVPEKGNMEVIEEEEKNIGRLFEGSDKSTVYKLLKFAPSKTKGRRDFLVVLDGGDIKFVSETEKDIVREMKDGKYKEVYNPQEVKKIPDRVGYFVVKNDTPGVPKRPKQSNGEKRVKLRSGEYRKRQTIFRKMEKYASIKEGVRCLVFLDYVGNPAHSFFAVDSKTREMMEKNGIDVEKLGVFISRYLRKGAEEEEGKKEKKMVEANVLREQEALDAMVELQSDVHKGGEMITNELISTNKRKRKRRYTKRGTAKKRNKPNTRKGKK